jgi:hypothetical protein
VGNGPIFCNSTKAYLPVKTAEARLLVKSAFIFGRRNAWKRRKEITYAGF